MDPLTDKRAAALEWLRGRGKHVLQHPHTRERHEAMQKALSEPKEVPKLAEKVRRIR